jgi:uncharacterized protein (TIGR00661 family)
LKLVFYISGHGYGHAVRDIEIVKSLLSIQPDTEIHFRTTAAPWLFKPLLNDRVRYHERELDFGVHQTNSFSADKRTTFERYQKILQHKDKLIDEEIAFLNRVQPDIILSDITPLAFDAAETYGQKAVAVGNFSWDWIYSEYVDAVPEFADSIQDIKQSYAKAERLWRIPFYGDMSAFPNPENIPLVARKANAPAEETRRRMGLKNDGTNYVLLGLRMSDLQDVDWQQLEKLQGITFVAVSRDIKLKNCIHLHNDDLPFEDVLNACDAIISKPGYSIVSEILANRTPMVYVPRRDFLEDPILIDALKKLAVAEELSQKDYYAGNWQGAFDGLFSSPQHWADIRMDGADVIAKKIVGRLT